MTNAEHDGSDEATATGLHLAIMNAKIVRWWPQLCGRVAVLRVMMARSKVGAVTHIEALAWVHRDDSRQLLRWVQWVLWRGNCGADLLSDVEVGQHTASDGQGVVVVVREVIRHTGCAAMHVGASQLLGSDHFTGGGLDQWGASQENGSVSLHDDALVAHGRDVRTTGRAGSHDDGDLRHGEINKRMMR